MTIANEMIRASAGSGKTWQLTNRYIALLGQQLIGGSAVTPERIIAVTFTKKAAGEFFDSILEKLAGAASHPEKARELSAGGTDPASEVLGNLTQENYLQLLRTFISRMPRLFLGTLDSFFSNIVRSFPAEFGLAGDFEVIDQHLETVVRERICRRVFALRPGRNNQEQQEFLEAFRRATFGKEGAGIQNVLDGFLKDLHRVWLRCPDETLWGGDSAIWPKTDGSPWEAREPDFEADFTRLFAIFKEQESKTADREKPLEYSWTYWKEFREQAPDYVPGAGFPPRVEYMLKRIFPLWNELLQGEAELKLNRKINLLTEPACRILVPLIKYFVHGELEIKQERTRGIWTLLNQYESVYGEKVRRRGQLTFLDIELLLAGEDLFHSGPGPVLSQMQDRDDRLQIDYRLDARYDHWMLDEFQDTSYTQWKAIANLIDEVVQDTSGTRTLFQVGDIKQAIYAWRGGDTRLFDDIAEHYNAHEELIQPRSLNVSWRSGKDVIDTVNRIFGNRDLFSQLDLPEATRDRWVWEDHQVPEKNQKIRGYCSLLNPVSSEGGKPTEEDCFATVVALLKEIQPVKRNINCAILVQQNKVGHALVNYIRSNCDIPVMSDSDISVATDNAINRAAISYLKCMAHPGDTFAWNHLRLTPFGKWIEEEQLTPEKISESGNRQLFANGFEHVILSFFRKMEEAAGAQLDAFNAGRAENLALAARLFDERGGRDVDEFLACARLHKVREPDTGSAVQVMTIHQSKGLTFDMVILPELGGQKLTANRPKIGVKRDEARETKWILDLPVRIIAQADPEINEYLKNCEADAAYEALCKLYVALTRARQANYLITCPAPKNSRSNNFIKLLEECLVSGEPDEDIIGKVPVSVAYQSNLTDTTDKHWYREFSIPEQATEEKTDAADSPDAPTVSMDQSRVRLSRRTPSGTEAGPVTGQQIFSRQGKVARELGTLVHALFEKMEWYEADSLESLKKQGADMPGFSESVKTEALKQIDRALTDRDIAAALSRPDGEAACWRERPFEILLGKEWLSGTFDRVVIEKEKATILDFKTSLVSSPENIGEDAEKYRAQLETYRKVLSRMISIPEEHIVIQLLFSRIPKIISL